MYYTYSCMNHPTIVIFTKFSTGFTPLYRYITKREGERNPYLQHLIVCYATKETTKKYITWFNRSVHFTCLLHPCKQYKGKHYDLGLKNLALTFILSYAILFQCIQIAQRLLREYSKVIASALSFIHSFQPSSNTIMTWLWLKYLLMGSGDLNHVTQV